MKLQNNNFVYNSMQEIYVTTTTKYKAKYTRGKYRKIITVQQKKQWEAVNK